MMKFPPRFTVKPIRWEDEAQERFVRVCPGCFKPLRWLHYHKFIRMDKPKATNDLDEIVWVPETAEYLVPRYIDVTTPNCTTHAEVHWWLIKDTEKDLFVGLASDHPTFWPELPAFDEAGNPVLNKKGEQKTERREGGALFRSPLRSTSLIVQRWKRARSSRISGRWKLDQGNKTRAALVVTDRKQLRLW